MTNEFIFNHLWQSSGSVLFAALLALMLRKNSPTVRFWVWSVASLKFLVPFALLVSLGGLIPRPARPVVEVSSPIFSDTLVQLAEPYSPVDVASVPAQAPISRRPLALGVLWGLGFVVVTLARCWSWLKVRNTLRAGIPVDLTIAVPARITPGTTEPGIVGLLRPVLVVPEHLLESLEPQQLDALLTHEMCHVRRHDNLIAALHMVVEALFWFNPLVWWIGARMVEERELACDEAVLRSGCEPADYVAGMLHVCRLYTKSPLPFSSGVTGADVKRRLRRILAGTIARELTGGKKVALALIATVSVALPIVVGVLTAPVMQAQIAPANTPTFEVASIRPCKDPSNGPAEHSSPGRLATDCHELLNLIGNAYNAFADGHLNMNAEPTPINGGPPWLQYASYDINAKAEGNPSVAMMLGPMMQRLLEDRFQLKIHRETREGPVYFLTVVRGGPKLQPFVEGSCTPWSNPPLPLQPGTKYCGSTVSGISSSAEALGATLDEFSKTLRILVDRPVIDKTGITGRFDIRVKFSREGTEMAAFTPRTVAGAGTVPSKGPNPVSDPAGPPSIFTALQEQLGLRLESGRGPVDMLVIDHIEKPTENHVDADLAETSFPIQIASTIPVVPPRRTSSPQTQKLQFEAATVKIDKREVAGGPEGFITCHGRDSVIPPDVPAVALGRCMALRATLRQLIRFVYYPRGVVAGNEQVVVGGPDWIGSSFWGIDASAENPSSMRQSELMSMFQNLLSERFALRFHRETKEIPGFALTVAKGGPKLRASEDVGQQDCVFADGTLTCRHVTVTGIAGFLTGRAGGPVVDRTGLTGAFDVIIPPTFRDPDTGGTSPTVSVFTMVQEQMGLRLEPLKVPLGIIVIDSAQAPPEGE